MGRPKADSAVAARFAELIEQLGALEGFAYGWQARVAERLGLHPTEISKIRRGERHASWDLAARAADTLGLDMAYFRAPPGTSISAHGAASRMVVQMTVGELETLIERASERAAARALEALRADLAPKKEHLTVREAAASLHYDERHIRRLVAVGQLPRVKLGGGSSRVLIPRRAVEAMLEAKCCDDASGA